MRKGRNETCQDYAEAKYINSAIGDVAVQDITPKFVDEFYVRLQKTKPVARKNKKPQSEYLTSGTIHSIHKILRCAFVQAVKWEIIM